MSEFDCEPSQNWLNRLKNLLLNEDRCISSPHNLSNSSPRKFLDFDQEFQEILEKKSIANAMNHNKENYKFSKMDFSFERSNNKNMNFNHSIAPLSPLTDSNCLEAGVTDNSFLFLERICNKSITDPDSTIHDYVEKMKKSNAPITKDEENNAMQRLFKGFNVTETTTRQSTLDFGDQTQLCDMEEPSALWETTVTNNDNHHISPTKMVGLLRPSTILEESNQSNYSSSESDNSQNSTSIQSYRTAQKTIETTSYETANESIRSETINTNLEFPFKKIKYKFFDDDLSTAEKSNQTKDSSILNKTKSKFEDSFDTDKNKISSISVDSLDNFINSNETKSPSIIKTNTKKPGFIKDVNNSCITISDDDEKLIENDNSFNETNSSNDINVSREFNDTMEEVEYILEKGMKNLKNTGTKPKIVKSATINTNVTPAKLRICVTPSSLSKSPNTPNTVIAKPNAQKLAQLNSNSDKKEPFKKPLLYGSSKIPQPRSFLNVKKTDQFSNVVSPVGAYIKNTPKTPICGNIRENTARSLHNEKSGKSVSKYNSKFSSETIAKEFSLPKKAYVSAEYRKVRDERTPLNIPGGQKIHKYLKSALLPAVARHDGKMKMGNSLLRESVSDADNTVDSSLADLSVMSGNVSFYTIRDAQKFGNK